jgi:DNA repair exonuclease SbcCD ATPase subunit
MIQVVITEIELENCGPWQGRHRFRIPEEGLAVFVAPNERGKSTLLRLIAATLWDYQPPAVNWFADPESPFWASVTFRRQEFAADNSLSVRKIRVTRDFRQGVLSVAEDAGNGSWRDLLKRRHRQRGRTPDQRHWEEHLLPQLFAPITADTFSNIAVIAQPWNYEIPQELIQRLIVGAGQATVAEVSETLLTRFRSLTRYSRQAGLHSHDAKNPGRLDQLRQQVEELEKQIERCRGVLERLEVLREKRRSLEEDLARSKREFEEREQQLSQIEEFRRVRRELARAEDTANRLERALSRSRELASRLQEARDKLKPLPSQLQEASPEDLENWRKTLAVWHRQRQALLPESALAKERQKLEIEFAEVKDLPSDTPDRINTFLGHHGKVEQLRRQREEAQAEMLRYTPRIDNRRRILAAGATGIAVGLVVMLVLGLVLVGLGGVKSVSLAILGGLVVGLSGTIVGGLSGWCVWQFYQPIFVPPEYGAAVDKLRQVENQLEEALNQLEEAQKNLPFPPGKAPVELGRLVEKAAAYQARLAEWRRKASEQKALQNALAVDKLPFPLPSLLEQTGGDVDSADRRLYEILDLQRKIREWQTELRSILQSFDCDSLEALERRTAEAVDARQNLRRQLDQMVQDSALVESLRQASPDEIDRKVRELTLQREETEGKLRTLQEEAHDLERKILREEAEATAQELANFNLAQAEMQLADLKGEIARLEQQAEAIRCAFFLLKEAENTFSQWHRKAVEDHLNSLMLAWTQDGRRIFRVDHQFGLSLEVAGENDLSAGGQDNLTRVFNLSVLSQGAWDQLALAVRLAVLDQVASVRLPVLLDDVFLTWDQNRRDRFQEGISSLVRGRQVILVTHDEEFLRWGSPLVHEVIGP